MCVCVCVCVILSNGVVVSSLLNVRVNPGHLFSKTVGLMLSFRHLDPHLRKRKGRKKRERGRETDGQTESSGLQCPCFRQMTRTAGICRTYDFFKRSASQNSNWLLHRTYLQQMFASLVLSDRPQLIPYTFIRRSL